MAKKVIFFICLLQFSSTSMAYTLCLNEEKPIFSFQVKKSKKILSICKGENPSYLAYRFGAKEKIELQFPSNMDERSWDKFEFSGLSRRGGKANAGFGSYSLSFSNTPAEYIVFQEWNDEDDSYSIGVTIISDGKRFIMAGERKTQQGSLFLLEYESKHIRNTDRE